MASLPQRSLSICSVQPRVFSQPWLCQVILPALAPGLSSGATQNLKPKGFRHSSWQVCEAQTCSQQLTQVHLAQGTVSRSLPLNSFVLTLPQPELFKPEQRRGISSGTGWGHSQPHTGLLQKPDLRQRQDAALWKQTNPIDTTNNFIISQVLLLFLIPLSSHAVISVRAARRAHCCLQTAPESLQFQVLKCTSPAGSCPRASHCCLLNSPLRFPNPTG